MVSIQEDRITNIYNPYNGIRSAEPFLPLSIQESGFPAKKEEKKQNSLIRVENRQGYNQKEVNNTRKILFFQFLLYFLFLFYFAFLFLILNNVQRLIKDCLPVKTQKTRRQYLD
jgi:hypothetical protein